MSVRRGVGICHYNRQEHLRSIIEHVREYSPEGTKIVVADDGSTDHELLNSVEKITRDEKIILIKGPNLGVAANKNRALFALRDCHYITLLEDDIHPIEKGWFELYEEATALSGIHHFCRVADEKRINEAYPKFSNFMVSKGFTAVLGSSPRGDVTFLTSEVLHKVGGFNTRFRGAGYAHGEWSERVFRSGLIPHPSKWVDIQEARDKFVQIGDTTGGRWNNPEKTKEELKRNKAIFKQLINTNYVFHPLVLE